MSTKPTAKELSRAARGLAKSGQPVFPCRPVHLDEKRKAKAPLIAGGLNSATLDKARIKDWWAKWPDAAIGIPTGIVWDVLDVDIKGEADGRVHLPYLQRLGLLDGCKKVAQTPSGGWHLYFPAAQGLTNKASATLGLDVRAKGGYVLAPPSWIDQWNDPGAEYAGAYVDHGETTGSTDDPLLWDLIVSALQPIDASTRKPIPLLPSERKASIASLREWVANRQSGERNNALHWAVCRCIDNNIDPYELMEAALLTGLSEAEIRLTMDSALRRAGLRAEDMDTEAEALFPDNE